MGLKKYLATAAAVSLVAAPAMAANPASSLSVAKSARVGSASAKKNELAGGGVIVAIIAAAAVIAGIVIVANEDDDADSNCALGLGADALRRRRFPREAAPFFFWGAGTGAVILDSTSGRGV